MKNSLLLILLLFILGPSAFAQDFKFKKVSKEELLEEFHPLDSTAVAAVLWEEGNLNMRYEDGFVYDSELTKRVKIYNQEGFDHATITIPFYTGDSHASKENIVGIKAYVYNLKDGKVESEKLKNKDFIEEESSEYWSQIKFTFPNIKPGSVIEYTYTRSSPHYTELPKWNFQDDIPVNLSQYNLTIPKMLSYKEQQRGFHFVERKVEDVKTTFSYSSGNSTSKTDMGSGRTEAIRYKYSARNVPKLKDEAFVNNIQNFMTSIKHELSYTKIGDGAINQYSTTWPEIAKDLQESEWFGKQIDDTKYFEEDLQPIIDNSQSDENLILNIFDFVKKNMKWNDYVGIYTSDKLRKVYKEKTGNIADVNLMLTSMLRHAGIDANPVLISTIEHGIPSNFVSRKDYNYIISAVNLNDQILLLDASSQYSSPNILPTRCINWFGHLIRPNGITKQISLQPQEKSNDSFLLNLDLNEDGDLEGQMRRQYTSHLAYMYRTKFTEVKRKDYIEKKANDYKIEIIEYENKNVENLSEPVVETMTFKKENAADVINDIIYFNPLLFLAQDENPFKQDQKERKLPIDFTFPFTNRYIINLKIPKGFDVDYLPKPTAVALPERKALFRYNIQKAPNGIIQIMVTEEINAAILPSDYYKPLKDYFSQIVEKETDKIVLKKL